MKKFAVVTLVALMLAIAPASQAISPLLFYFGVPLVNKLLTPKPELVSDAALTMSAHIFLDGRQMAAAFDPVSMALVIGKVPGHSVELCLAPELMMRPGLTDGIARVKVSCSLLPDFVFLPADAVRMAQDNERGERRRYRPLRDRDVEKGQPSEQDWLVPIDINRIPFGGYRFTVDVFFRNGNRGDSLRGFVYLFVTDKATIAEAVNDSDIQAWLSMLGGVWSPIPALVPNRYEITPGMAHGSVTVERSRVDGVMIHNDDSNPRLENVPPASQTAPPALAPAPDLSIAPQVRVAPRKQLRIFAPPPQEAEVTEADLGEIRSMAARAGKEVADDSELFMSSLLEGGDPRLAFVLLDAHANLRTPTQAELYTEGDGWVSLNVVGPMRWHGFEGLLYYFGIFPTREKDREIFSQPREMALKVGDQELVRWTLSPQYPGAWIVCQLPE